jgi:hypothetical protein
VAELELGLCQLRELRTPAPIVWHPSLTPGQHHPTQGGVVERGEIERSAGCNAAPLHLSRSLAIATSGELLEC